jgi:hypothetical protein
MTPEYMDATQDQQGATIDIQKTVENMDTQENDQTRKKKPKRDKSNEYA